METELTPQWTLDGFAFYFHLTFYFNFTIFHITLCIVVNCNHCKVENPVQQCLRLKYELGVIIDVVFEWGSTLLQIIQSNLLSKYLEGHTKWVLLIRGTYLLSVLVSIVYMS